MMNRIPQSFRCRIRSGFTLIELMVVFSLLASVLVGTLTLLSLIRRSGDQADEDFRIRQEFRRFAGDLRRDVYQASDLKINPRDSKAVLQVAEKSIEYRFVAPSTLTRMVDSESTSNPRDQYDFGREFDVTLQSIDDGQTIQWSFQDRNKNKVPIQIMATLGNQT
jgi:prepilin-type N-terminal cleavage/methylation domain-containing protein